MTQRIIKIKLTNHPSGVCQYPKTNRQIMVEFRNHFSKLKSDEKSEENSWEYHYYTKYPQIQNPTSILYQPAGNMQVFKLSD